MTTTAELIAWLQKTLVALRVEEVVLYSYQQDLRSGRCRVSLTHVMSWNEAELPKRMTIKLNSMLMRENKMDQRRI